MQNPFYRVRCMGIGTGTPSRGHVIQPTRCSYSVKLFEDRNMDLLETFSPICLNSFHKSTISVVKVNCSVLLSFLPLSLEIPSTSSQSAFVNMCVYLYFTHCYKFKQYRKTYRKSQFCCSRKPLTSFKSTRLQFMLLIHTYKCAFPFVHGANLYPYVSSPTGVYFCEGYTPRNHSSNLFLF